MCNTYQYGMVESVEEGRDGKIRKVHVRYRNSTEETDRLTYRSTRSLIMIHPVDELDLMEEMGQVASKVDAENHKSQAGECNSKLLNVSICSFQQSLQSTSTMAEVVRSGTANQSMQNKQN